MIYRIFLVSLLAALLSTFSTALGGETVAFLVAVDSAPFQEIQCLKETLLQGGVSKNRIHLIVNQRVSDIQPTLDNLQLLFDNLDTPTEKGSVISPDDLVFIAFVGGCRVINKDICYLPPDTNLNSSKHRLFSISNLLDRLGKLKNNRCVLLLDSGYPSLTETPITLEVLRKQNIPDNLAFFFNCVPPQEVRQVTPPPDASLTRWFVDLLRSDADLNGDGRIEVGELLRAAEIRPERFYFQGFRRDTTWKEETFVLTPGFQISSPVLPHFSRQQTIDAHAGAVVAISFTGPSGLFITGAKDQFKIFQASDGRLLFSESLESEITSVALSTRGKYFAVATNTAEISLWDAETLESRPLNPPREFVQERDRKVRVVFSEDERKLLAATSQGAFLWDIDPVNLIDTIRSEISTNVRLTAAACFRPGTSQVLTAFAESPISLWSASAEHLRNYPGFDSFLVNDLAFSPNGEVFAAAFQRNRKTVLWDIEGDEGRIWPDIHTEEITCLAFSPDGRFLLSGSLDETLLLRNATTGKVEQQTGTLGAGVTSICFSPDGNRIFAGLANGKIVIFQK